MPKNKVNLSKAEQLAREEILNLVAKALGQEVEEKELEISYPPEGKLGDYAVPCFLLGKKLQSSPAAIAKSLAEKIQPDKLIEKAEAAGPYINFFVNRGEFSRLVLTQVYKEKNKYGSSKRGKGVKAMIEFFSPNANKPLTIGHVRNIALGQSITNLLKFTSHKVITSTLYNDRGIAIVKAILGYQKWSNAKTPKEVGLKPDHFVGSFYVKFSQEEEKDKNLENEAKRALQAWEEDEPKIRKIWQKLMSWVYEGFKQTLKKLEVGNFDEEYYESEFYTKGKQLVEQGLARGVFKKHPEGYIYAPLEKYGLPDKILLRSDGTSLYMTQDMHLAAMKNRHGIDHSIYVIGSEQDLQMKQLFKILELLKFDNLKKLYHLSYGLVRLPNGKIKSRQGLIKGTSADEIIEELEILARAEIKSRFPGISEKDLRKRTSAIALSAIKFYILLANPKTTMVFEPQKSISFTGKTGPYLQYTHARINSLFQKSGIKASVRVDFGKINSDEEFDLVKILGRFPETIDSAVENYDPSDLTNYLYDLAKQFSLFYETMPVLKSDEKTKKARLLLARDVQIVLATGLTLLGIRPIEKM